MGEKKCKGDGPVAPAVGNAVFAAVGIRLQAVPLTPDKVWVAMNTKKA